MFYTGLSMWVENGLKNLMQAQGGDLYGREQTQRMACLHEGLGMFASAIVAATCDWVFHVKKRPAHYQKGTIFQGIYVVNLYEYLLHVMEYQNL